MEYETIIGLEVHAQLLTRSKMYCGCSADYASTSPNTHVCPVCLGMPGVLPVINRQAVEYTMMTALALNCDISEITKFDRKNYPYPDLMKGYQISQFDMPIATKGWLEIEADGQKRKAGITRVHLEEDVAKLQHRASFDGDYSLVDVNRSGVPLMEIVGEPDLRSPEEARQYLMKLRTILQFLGVSTGNMEEGSFRCDANISIRPVGSTEYLAKVEVKNMNSFKAVFLALEFEAKRQRTVATEGRRLVQETRGWVEEQGKTVSQRSKEYAHDYRYFPEPDLPPIIIARDWMEAVRAKLPELPEARHDRFMAKYGLPAYDAALLTGSKGMADFFDTYMKSETGEPAAKAKAAKEAANWLLGEFTRLLNATDTEIEKSQVTPERLRQLIALKDSGAISQLNAKEVFEEMFRSGRTAREIIDERGLSQLSDTAELEKIVADVLNSNARAVADFRAGKDTALKFLVGQVMRATKGRANPGLVNDLLSQKLAKL